MLLLMVMLLLLMTMVMMVIMMMVMIKQLTLLSTYDTPGAIHMHYITES